MSSDPHPAAASNGGPPPRQARDKTVEEIDRVFRILREELGVLVKTSTPTTKAIAVVLMGSFVVHLLLGTWTAPLFALVPDKTVPRLWNIVTSGFYEINLILVVVDVLGVLYLGRLLEPIWGTEEFIRFVFVTQSSVGTAAFVTMYVLYIATRSQFYLFAQFSGFHGVLVALTVALRQQLPEERVPLPPLLGAALRLRNKHLPGAYLAVTFLLSILNGAKHHHIGLWLFAAYGALVGWCYLRYFQKVKTNKEGDEENTYKFGDDREEFEFAAQFPEACAPGIRTVTDPIHALLCGGKIMAGGSAYTALENTVEEDGTSRGDEAETLEPTATDETSSEKAEKRRARAERGAKLLEEKMRKDSAKKPNDGT